MKSWILAFVGFRDEARWKISARGAHEGVGRWFEGSFCLVSRRFSCGFLAEG